MPYTSLYISQEKKEFIIEKDIISRVDNSACYRVRDCLNHK